MFVLTAKVNKKKIAIVLAAIAALIAVLVIGMSRDNALTTGAELSVSTNDDRVHFLTSHGWEVVTSPVETSQVRIPSGTSAVFSRYNALQKSMGYDLSQYAGKTVMRYVYTVKNYPGATEPVYATILICDNRIIGGDITNTAPTGKIQGFQKQTE